MAEAGGGPISVIARHMQLIRDDFISELFDKMKAEIRGLDYDARMADLWRASITENFVTAVHYLDRDTAVLGGGSSGRAGIRPRRGAA
ncbi:Uncharacterised protein [Mycobacterium tuberculosis]|nr:Uncharacterised protein [Mycobacterium tuberculosis]